MVTKEQLIKGIINYIEKEIMPYLSTANKWLVGTIVVLANRKSNEIINELCSNGFLKSLDVVNDEGLINLELLCESIKSSADKYGDLIMDIPCIGTLKFSSKDIDSIKQYIDN